MNKIARQTTVADRNAMTLVELTVAIALSAMLMVALIGVLGGIAKQVKLSRRYDTSVWPNRVATLLRRDLGAAESLWMDAGELWMRTDVPSYHSDAKGVREIGYRCTAIDNELSILERIDANQTSVLAIGPERLYVQRIDSAGIPQPLPRTPGPAPKHVRLWIHTSGNQDAAWVRDLVLH